MGILSGPKFNSRHQTYIPSSEGLLSELKGLASVKKIFLGRIAPAPPNRGDPHAKITSVQGNLFEIRYRGKTAVQIFRVVSGDPEPVNKVVGRYQRKRKNRAKPETTQSASPRKPGVSAPKKKAGKARRSTRPIRTEPARLGDLFPELAQLKAKRG